MSVVVFKIGASNRGEKVDVAIFLEHVWRISFHVSDSQSLPSPNRPTVKL
jgi:hypothetical protein